MAPHDSAFATGSGLMAVLSGADCGAKSDGNEALLRGFGWQGLGVCIGLCRWVWDRGSGTATMELCAIGLGRVEGHGSKQVGYIQCQDD